MWRRYGPGNSNTFPVKCTLLRPPARLSECTPYRTGAPTRCRKSSQYQWIAAHATLFRQAGQIDGVDGPRHRIRIGMRVNIDDAVELRVQDAGEERCRRQPHCPPAPAGALDDVVPAGLPGSLVRSSR